MNINSNDDDDLQTSLKLYRLPSLSSMLFVLDNDVLTQRDRLFRHLDQLAVKKHTALPRADIDNLVDYFKYFITSLRRSPILFRIRMRQVLRASRLIQWHFRKFLTMRDMKIKKVVVKWSNLELQRRLELRKRIEINQRAYKAPAHLVCPEQWTDFLACRVSANVKLGRAKLLYTETVHKLIRKYRTWVKTNYLEVQKYTQRRFEIRETLKALKIMGLSSDMFKDINIAPLSSPTCNFDPNLVDYERLIKEARVPISNSGLPKITQRTNLHSTRKVSINDFTPSMSVRSNSLVEETNYPTFSMSERGLSQHAFRVHYNDNDHLNSNFLNKSKTPRNENDHQAFGLLKPRTRARSLTFLDPTATPLSLSLSHFKAKHKKKENNVPVTPVSAPASLHSNDNHFDNYIEHVTPSDLPGYTMKSSPRPEVTLGNVVSFENSVPKHTKVRESTGSLLETANSTKNFVAVYSSHSIKALRFNNVKDRYD